MTKYHRHAARIALVLVLVAALSAASCSGGTGPASLPRARLDIRTQTEVVAIRVEVAKTAEARRVGLMGRRTLAPDAGIAFLFPGSTDQPFWMKDTFVPLSIAFWDRNRRIVAVLDMEPCRADPCPLYRSPAPYVGAVEVNRGFFVSHGIGVGDAVSVVPASITAGPTA